MNEKFYKKRQGKKLNETKEINASNNCAAPMRKELNIQFCFLAPVLPTDFSLLFSLYMKVFFSHFQGRKISLLVATHEFYAVMKKREDDELKKYTLLSIFFP